MEDNTVEIDARGCHSSILFFQDRGSKYTVAVDRATGEVLGESPHDSASLEVRKRVNREVRRYRFSREPAARGSRYGVSSTMLVRAIRNARR